MKYFNTILLLFSCWYTGNCQEVRSSLVTSVELDAYQLGAVRKIWVYLPVDYEKSRRKFPVIYMHDAQNLFDSKTSFSGEWGVDETMNTLAIKAIVVGIEHGNDKRMEELTPFPNENYGGGNADAYLNFLVTVVKPYVDGEYRTKSSAEHTTILGSSLGGLLSLYALAKHPETFGKAGVFSPSFWFSDSIYTYMDNAKLNQKAENLYDVW